MLTLLLACAAPEPPSPPAAPPSAAPLIADAVEPPPAAVAPPPPLPPYPTLRAGLESQRQALAARWAADPAGRPALLAEARTVLIRGLTGQLFPAWAGTPWDFNGIASAPGEAPIACGYFVSTTLQHAGFELNRYRLAQQASARIAATFVPQSELRWRRDDLPGALADVQSAGESLWIVGLDFHVGFLWNDGSKLQFCHSNYIDAAGVVCEEAAASAALAASRVHVLAQLFDDAMLEKWLRGSTIEVVTAPVAAPAG